MTSASSRSRGTTQLTKSSASASRASISLLSNRMALALRGWRSHGTEKYWKFVGRKSASSAATMTSQAEAIIQPAKMQ